ncbi:MAG: catechol 2,3-dioxygenase-like lactoylglutathione lyase family enzyme [Halieaceae bacterium]|jgi:catechol 2,3-dioxygenase-like lactoylglutathione lyase family enzyme
MGSLQPKPATTHDAKPYGDDAFCAASMPPTARSRGKIAPAKLAHVVMRCRRYDDMVRWYRTVLEAEFLYANDMISFLTYDEEHHRIALTRMPGLLPKFKQMAGVDHIAFTYASLTELLQTYSRLKLEGIEPHWCINHGGTTSLYYEDPDGNQIELQVDAFKTDQEMLSWLESDSFNQNPIGVDFNPQELIRRMDAGESELDLLKRPPSGPRALDSLPKKYLGRVMYFMAKMATRLRIQT